MKAKLIFSLLMVSGVCSQIEPAGAQDTNYLSYELVDSEWIETNDSYDSFVDVNSIFRLGDRVVFDAVDPEAAYLRLYGDCRENQIGTLRVGYFQSRTSVEARSVENTTMHALTPVNSFSQGLLELACNYPTEPQDITGQILDSKCRQGACWETTINSIRLIHDDQLAGNNNRLYELSLTVDYGESTTQINQWAYCSISEPFVASQPDPAGDFVVVDFLGITNDIQSPISEGFHQIYWAVCHDALPINIWDTAHIARALGYYTSGEDEIVNMPKALFESILSER